MKDEISIQNKLRKTGNKYTYYIHHEIFCNFCMETNVIPTGISIKRNHPLVYGVKSLLPIGKQQNKSYCTIKTRKMHQLTFMNLRSF